MVVIDITRDKYINCLINLNKDIVIYTYILYIIYDNYDNANDNITMITTNISKQSH